MDEAARSRYKILEELGAGGMGVVYKAEDTKLGRIVALKFLPQELAADEVARKRLIHEARAASSLQHENICTIHDIESAPDGRLFISMDYYDGETLKACLSRGPLSADEAIRIAAQIACGLEAAHSRRVIHRDIKPANVMITRQGVVKILDFGLAQRHDQSRMTRTGSTVGTAAYMSPEQIHGEDLDERTDIFSLGATLYEMLMGRSPFAANHEAAMMHKILNVAPPSLVDTGVRNAAELNAIVGRMLAKSRDQRYRSAAETMRALESLGSRPAAAGRSRRIRNMVAVSALAIAVAAVITIRPWRTMGPAGADAAIAVIDFTDTVSPSDGVFTAGLTRLLSAGLTESSTMRVVSPDLVYDVRRRRFPASTESVRPEQALEVARESRATIMVTGERIGIEGGSVVLWRVVDVKSGRALASSRVTGTTPMELADGIVVGVLAEIEPDRAPGAVSQIPVDHFTTASPEAYRLYVEAMLAWDAGKGPDAEIPLLTRAIAIDSTFAQAHFELSRMYFMRDNRVQSLRHADRAWKLRERLSTRERLRLQAFRCRIGMEDRSVDCAALYRAFLQHWPDDKRAVDEYCEHVAYSWNSREEADAARRALQLYPDEPRLLAHLGAGLLNTDQEKDAVATFRRLVRVAPEGGDYWDWLGRAYIAAGFPDSAEAAFHRALETVPTWTWAREGLAEVAFARGDVNRAVQVMEDWSRQVDREEPAYKHVIGSLFSLSLSVLLAEQGRYQRSIDVFDALEPDIEISQPFDYLFVEALIRAGRWEDALEWCKKRTERDEIPGDAQRLWSENALWFQWLQGYAFVGMGSLAAAAKAEHALRKSLPPSNTRQGADMLAAEIALAAGEPDTALFHLARIEKFGTFRPGPWDYRFRDYLARACRDSGKHQEAEAILRANLHRYAGHAINHYDLGVLYQDMGRRAEARVELAKFLDMWSQADEGIAVVADARARLAALGGPPGR